MGWIRYVNILPNSSDNDWEDHRPSRSACFITNCEIRNYSCSLFHRKCTVYPLTGRYHCNQGSHGQTRGTTRHGAHCSFCVWKSRDCHSFQGRPTATSIKEQVSCENEWELHLVPNGTQVPVTLHWHLGTTKNKEKVKYRGWHVMLVQCALPPLYYFGLS